MGVFQLCLRRDAPAPAPTRSSGGKEARGPGNGALATPAAATSTAVCGTGIEKSALVTLFLRRDRALARCRSSGSTEPRLWSTPCTEDESMVLTQAIHNADRWPCTGPQDLVWRISSSTTSTESVSTIRASGTEKLFAYVVESPSSPTHC